MMQFLFHVTCSCISYTYVLYFSIYFLYLNCFGAFLIVSLFPSLFCLCWLCLWHLSINPLRLGTLFIPMPLRFLILLLSLFGSVMMMPTWNSWRTFLDAAFILNAKSFWQTSPTPTFPLSFTIEDGSHYVMSWSLFLLCLSKSFTSTCTSFSTSFLYSCSRYAHSYHTAACCGCA